MPAILYFREDFLAVLDTPGKLDAFGVLCATH